MNRTSYLWCVLFLTLLPGCPGEQEPVEEDYTNVMSFDTTVVRLVRGVDTIPLKVELAVSDDQKVMGLMERKSLAPDAGMLFVYDRMQPGEAGFWMYRTRIPLDIAYLDSTGVIRAVKSMTPCPTTIAQGCPTYNPDVRYQYALEVNAGFFGRHGLATGHSLLLADVPNAAPVKR